MPIQTTCPGCQRPLRVPDDLIGQAVRCPGCATTWTVESPPESPPPPAELPPTPEPPPSPTDKSADAIRDTAPDPGPPAERQEHIRESPGGTSAPSPPPPPIDRDFDDDDEEDDEQFERDIEERWERRRDRWRLQDAKKKLIGPAIGLLVTSALILLVCLFRLVTGAFGVYTASSAPGPVALMVVSQGVMLIYAVWLALVGGVTLFGGLKMLKVRSWHWSLAACITAMIPNCECCFLIGMPIGIWGLVMLFQPDVKRAFFERTGPDDLFPKTPAEED